MWFVTLVKNTQAPTKENAMMMQENMKTAESWGVKFHQGFFTLGPYDAVWISEAPDEKTAMRVAMLFNSKMGGSSVSMPAVASDEVMGWVMKM
jgi:uncharacterized protein with GYD domain